MSSGTNWRILVVEDVADIRRQLLEAIPGFVEAPDTAEAEICDSFNDAIQRLREDRYDVVILDLKDDSNGWELSDDDPAGLRVFEELKQTKFVPVIFYTALAHKVRAMETSFVRIVEKTESIARVKQEVNRVLATKLPALTRHIEEIQRDYMWEFVNIHWKDFDQPDDQAEIAYLLARRLAIALESEAGALASTISGETGSAASKVHPMAMYIVPPLGPHPLAGDIVSEDSDGKTKYWLILTPSCDFAQSKANHVTLARCEPLVDREEFKKWSADKKDSSIQRLRQLIKDAKGDRFKFLPRAFFIPDLVVDFQQLRSIKNESLQQQFNSVASLDSPFAESVLARFCRYFNRLGTPDLDIEFVVKRVGTKSGLSSDRQ